VVTVSAGLVLKPTTMVFSGLTSKPVATVFSRLTSKLVATVSPCLASKPADGFLIEPQNQGGEGFSGLALKTGISGLVNWTSKPRRHDGWWCTWHHREGCVGGKLKTDESM
jgi:hypothetical protein